MVKRAKGNNEDDKSREAEESGGNDKSSEIVKF